MITFIFFISDNRNIFELQIEKFNDIPDPEISLIELIRCPSFESVNELCYLIGVNDVVPANTSTKLFSINDNFLKKLTLLDDQQLKDIGVQWAGQPSWKNIDINPLDLAGFLLCFKEKITDILTVKHSLYALIER